MNKSLILVLWAEFLITLGQICLKKSTYTLKPKDHRLKEAVSWIGRIVQLVLCEPWAWLGILLMLIGSLWWFAALSSGELSFVYLLGSIQYIFMLFAAHLFLGEKINKTKLAGTILITIGIILTANS